MTTVTIIQARTDFQDLENLGWDFSDLYEGVAEAQGISIEKAEEWEKENYHVEIFLNYDGEYWWIPSNNESGRTGDAQHSGDNQKTIKDLEYLHNNAGLWEVFTKDDEE